MALLSQMSEMSRQNFNHILYIYLHYNKMVDILLNYYINHVGNKAKETPQKTSQLLMGPQQVMRPKTLQGI